MSKRTFYYWISGSVSQESLFLVIHLSIAGPMHRNGRRVSVWTEEDEGDLIWMDTHSSLSVIRSFSLQANDTNWHFVEPLESWVSRTRCAVEVRRTCYDMVMSSFYARHLHIIIIEWVVGEDWGGGYEEHTSHWQDTVDLIHICLTFHEFDAMQTWRQFFYFYPHGVQCLPMLLLLDPSVEL